MIILGHIDVMLKDRKCSLGEKITAEHLNRELY